MSVTLSPPMYLQFFSAAGVPALGYQLFTYIAGTSTKQATWNDSTQTSQNSNPIVLDSQGAAYVWLDPTLTYKFVLALPNDTDPPTGSVRSVDNIQGPITAETFASFITAALIGSVLYPRTAAEIAAGVTPTNYGYAPGNVLRYGIVPNSSGAATANSTSLALVLNATTGLTGLLTFPNTTGSDIYYFNGIAFQANPIGVSIELNGCVLNFSKTYSSGTDDAHGFIEAIANFECRNGEIIVNYTGGGSNNAGPAFRFGSRSGYPFGSYTGGIFDADDNVFMGKIKLTNMTINSNCTSAPIIWMIGGIDGLIFDNLAMDGALGQGYAIAYEYGFSSTNGQPGTIADWSSSHARNMSFRNIRLTNLLTTATGEGALDLGGAYDCLVENLAVDTAYTALQFRAGEALYYRPWSRDAAGVNPAHMVAKNITAQNIANIAIVLKGKEPSGGSYLSSVITALGHPGDYIAQTDLIHCTLDSFAVSASGPGVAISGPGSISNGVVSASSNGIILDDECCWFDINNVRILNSSGIGIRGNFGGAIWSPARLKMGQIRNSKICGCVTNPAITLQNCRDVMIESNQLGFNTIWDAANESTQTYGVNVDGTNNGGGVICRGNYVTTASGNGYDLQGTIAQIKSCCSINSPKGNAAFTGAWDVDGIMQASATTIADKTSYVNNLTGASGVTNKYLGRQCYDTTNTRLMIAQGSTDTSNWERADGGASVTPA